MCALMLFANPARVTISGESTPRKGSAGHVRDQPKQTFAEVLPLANAKVQSKSDKNVQGERPVADKRNGSQIATNAAQGRNQSVLANRWTPSTQIDSPGHRNEVAGRQVKMGGLGRNGKTSIGVDAKKEKAHPAGIISPSLVQPQAPATEPKREKLRASIPEAGGVPPRPKSNGHEVGEPQRLVQQGLTVNVAQARPGQRVVVIPPQAVTGREAAQPARNDRVLPGSAAVNGKQVRAESPGGTEFRRGSGRVSTEQVQPEPPRGQAAKLIDGVAQNSPRRAEVNGEPAFAAAVKQYPDGMADSRAKACELKGASLSMPTVTQTPSKDAPVVPGDKSNQIPAKRQVGKQDPGRETPSRTHATSDGPRPDGRQIGVSGRETTYVNGSGKEESVLAGRKAAPGSREAVPVRPETTAPAYGEPVVAGRLADTARVGADSTAVAGPAQTIGEQILDSVRAAMSRGDNQLSIRLHPPELGTVLVRFQEQEGRISGSVEVAESDTRRQIEQALPQVLRSLQDAGVDIQKLEVVPSGPSMGELGRGHAQQETWPQPQGWGQERGHPSPARWRQSGESYPADPQEGPSGEQQGSTASGRIDVLL